MLFSSNFVFVLTSGSERGAGSRGGCKQVARYFCARSIRSSFGGGAPTASGWERANSDFRRPAFFARMASVTDGSAGARLNNLLNSSPSMDPIETEPAGRNERPPWPTANGSGQTRRFIIISREFHIRLISLNCSGFQFLEIRSRKKSLRNTNLRLLANYLQHRKPRGEEPAEGAREQHKP